jgi:hypothetical protein
MLHSAIKSQPPVLIDIGASGELPQLWKLLAPYSICVAFDADTRDFVVSELDNGAWHKKYSFNRLVAPEKSAGMDFYLTKSPHCSSTLQPDCIALKPWAFHPLFDVKEVVKLPAIDLQSALSEIDINYIDWYKTDSQGTDLRIFDSLPVSIVREMIIAEFEPGIIDAYKGEDKLHQLMAHMDQLPFWVSHMQIKGSQRIHKSDLFSLNYLQKIYIQSFLKTAPGWCEISYINTIDDINASCRQYLLAWIFATLKGEHGFGLHIARNGFLKFQDPIFTYLKNQSHKKLSSPLNFITLASRAWRKLIKLFQFIKTH